MGVVNAVKTNAGITMEVHCPLSLDFNTCQISWD